MYEAVFVLVLLAALMAAFISERFPPEAVALSAAAAVLVTGILTTEQALDALSNPAPFTVACMFVLSAALERTGCIDALGRTMLRVAAGSKFGAYVGLALLAIVISAFVNNTAVVVVLIPVAFRIAGSLRMLPSRLLMPLSYAAIFGGTCTLVGTSTNLVADGVAQRMGLAPFGIFEITPLGLIFVAVGIVYLAVLYRFLPDRPAVSGALANLPPRRFITEIVVPVGSRLIGKTLEEAGLTNLKGARVIDVLRFDESNRHTLATIRLEGGDRLVVRGEVAGVLALRETAGLAEDGTGDLQETGTRQTVLVEGVIGPGSGFIGHLLSEFNLRRRYNVYAIAVHRQGENLGDTPESVRFEVGDCLLLEGPLEGIHRLLETGDLISLNEPREPLFLRNKAPIAIATIAAVLLAATYDLMPIAGAAFLGSLLVVATGCVGGRDLTRAIDWPVLAIIYAMLVIGAAMHTSGADGMVVSLLSLIGDGMGPYLLLAVVYIVAVLLTEIITNNAVAILVTPIAIGVAQNLGVDPRPFVVAVMFAASASFATPIGYQTNTLVYTAGGYRYLDFVRAGVPLTLLFWVTASIFIPVLWPFEP